uniref:Ribonuclease H-like domain-containing protein n=1 Tax=Tanacetum cinerariifolium TaxID=118510 RepID=A0A6L2K8R0_TANCI|nr:ribonuclease H-like domain-containing protein [Tanacetum cinerariifolium]
MDELREDVRKINTNREKKSLHEEIKSIRTSEISYDKSYPKLNIHPTNLKDTFEYCMKESCKRQDVLNGWMKKFMINTEMNLKDHNSSIKRLEENVNHLAQLISTHNLTNQDLGSFPNNNDLLPNLESQDTMFLSPSRIKSLIDVVGITAAHVFVNTAQMELVLLKNFNEKYTKCLLLVEVKTARTKVNDASRISTASAKVTTASEVIENGATLPKTQVVESVTTVMPITTVEQKAQRRNKADLDTMNMDDLYNNLKVTNGTVNTAQVVNTANKVSTASTQVNVAFFINIDNLIDVVICLFFASQPSSPQLVHKDLEQIHLDDTEEINLRWQMAMLTMRARRFLKRTRRKLTINGNETIGFDKSNVECYNCHKRGHFARECRAPKNQDNKHKKSSRRSVPLEKTNSISLVSCDGLGGYDWSDQAEEGPNYALMAFTSLISDSKVFIDSNCSKSCLETVKLLKSQNEQLLKDLKKSELMVLGYKTGLESVEELHKFFKTNESIYLEDIKVLKVKIQMKEIAIRELRKKLKIAQKEKDGIQLNLRNVAKSSQEETKAVRKNDDSLIIKEWMSDNKEENATQPKIKKKIVRRNKTLIEATRTMLADSMLPITFWAKAVNTACYVQNRVLVVKPHNKTPYELFHGRTPTLSFIRPFGCHVTILNTIDHLGKFNRMAEEGFFVGFSLNSKAFRVFNSRTRIVEKSLHIRFSESTPNVIGSGPDWLFDINALTRTINYEPIVAGTKSNGFASIKASDNASQARKETEHVKDYILLPLWTASSGDGKKVDEDPRKENECKDQEKEDNVNNTNNVNTVRNDEDDDAMADIINLDTTIQVSPTPTTRIHKDHPLDQLIRDLHSVPITKNITRKGNSCIERSKLDRGYSGRAFTIQVTRSLDFSGFTKIAFLYASKQERRIDDIDQDEEITLVNDQDDAKMCDVNDLGCEEVFIADQNKKVVEEVVNLIQVSTAITTVTITTEEIM